MFSVAVIKYSGKRDLKRNEFVCLAECGCSMSWKGGNSSKTQVTLYDSQDIDNDEQIICFSLYLFIQSSINIPIGE